MPCHQLRSVDMSFKARFVIKGFQEQVEVSDSPTASRETLKVFCSIAANEKWLVEASDVNAAFLQSDPIDREIYIYPPPERAKDGFIWKLIKPVYGLKDSSRQWYKTMEKYLLNLGMKQSYRDSCLFSFRKKDALMGIILLHVDDMLSCGNHQFYNSIITPLR